MPEIVGQIQALNYLINSYKQNKLGHAYIFLGPNGVGKSLVAKFFAQLINCKKNDKVPCCECEACRKIEHDEHPDIFWIEPEEDSQGIKIAAIREIQERISLKPNEAQFKIFVIKEADYILEDAANCLLKTLEEPPQNSILILMLENRDKILPTILSRCQIIKFHPLKHKDLKEYLIDKAGIEQEKAEFLSRISSGSLEKAISYLETDLLDRRRTMIEGLFYRTDLDDSAWTNKRFFTDSINMLSGVFRDALFVMLGLNDLVVNIDQRRIISEITSKYSTESLLELIEKINSYQGLLESNANSKLVLTNLEMDLERNRL